MPNQSNGNHEQNNTYCKIVFAIKRGFYRIISKNKTSREKKVDKYTRQLRNWTAIMAVVGIATVIVLFLQYDTLDKTDHTLREGQRAFVFFRELARGQTVEKDQSTIWTFIPNLENNGNTQTKKALIGISCEKSGIQKFYDGYLKPDGPRVFGPKQIIGAGGCSWTSTFLDQQRLSRTPSYIGGVVEYEDIFGGRHVTKYCRQLYVLSDPNPKGINLEHITGLCPDTPDCADEECKSQK